MPVPPRFGGACWGSLGLLLPPGWLDAGARALETRGNFKVLLLVLKAKDKWEFCIATAFEKDCRNNWGLVRKGRNALEGGAARETERGWRKKGWAGGHHSAH